MRVLDCRERTGPACGRHSSYFCFSGSEARSNGRCIGPDGTIGFPLAGHIQAAGQTPVAIENALRTRLQKNYADKLDITVTLAAVNEKDKATAAASADREKEEVLKPTVFVTGEVLRPGSYLINAWTNPNLNPIPGKNPNKNTNFNPNPKTTVMQAITLAGGVGLWAAKQRITVHRKIQGIDTIFYFDYNGFESGREATADIELEPGDVIVVPERGPFE